MKRSIVLAQTQENTLVVARRLGCPLAVVNKGVELGLTLNQIDELGYVAHIHGVTVNTAINVCAKLTADFRIDAAQNYTEEILDITSNNVVSRSFCIRTLVESRGNVESLHDDVEDMVSKTREDTRCFGISITKPMSENNLDRRLGVTSGPRRRDDGDATPKDLFSELESRHQR